MSRFLSAMLIAIACFLLVQVAGCGPAVQLVDMALSDQKLFYKLASDVDAFGSPIVIGKDDTIYFTATTAKSSYLYSVDPKGSLKWRLAFRGKLISNDEFETQPLVISGNGMLFIGFALQEGQGGLYAVEPSGRIGWIFKEFAPSKTPATGADGSVYFSSNTGMIVALDKNGKKKWSYQARPEGVITQLAVNKQGKVYYGDSEGTLYALNQRGLKEWSYKTGSKASLSAPFVADDGTIYISYSTINYEDLLENDRENAKGAVVAVSPAGIKKWAYKGDGTSSKLLQDRLGTICYMNDLGAISALNNDGSIKWSHKDRESLDYNFFLKGLDNRLYLYTGDHSFDAYMLDDKGEYEVCGYVSWSACQSPAVDSKGNIFLTGDEGIYVIRR